MSAHLEIRSSAQVEFATILTESFSMLDFKKATVSRIAALLTAMCPCIVAAHPCPYDWNIEFAADAEIKGATLSDFVVKFNEAVKKGNQRRCPSDSAACGVGVPLVSD